MGNRLLRNLEGLKETRPYIQVGRYMDVMRKIYMHGAKS